MQESGGKMSVKILDAGYASTGTGRYKRDEVLLRHVQFAIAQFSEIIIDRRTPPTDMKVVIFLVAIVTAALGAPQGGDRDATIVRSELDNIGTGGYNYLYETSNGISAQEQGQLENAGSDNEIMKVRGQFSFVGQDGVTYTVTYIADENGFQPQGAHLPQA